MAMVMVMVMATVRSLPRQARIRREHGHHIIVGRHLCVCVCVCVCVCMYVYVSVCVCVSILRSDR
jgi:hypothetical protein